MKQIINSTFARFLMTGVLNTGFGYGSMCVFTYLLGNAFPAIILSNIAGILFNFKSYGRLVFRTGDNSRIYRFIGVYVILIGLQLLVLKALNLLGVENPYLAVALMILPMSVISFVALRKFVFHLELSNFPGQIVNEGRH